MTLEEFLEKDRALRHAIQTGVAYEMERGVRSAEPKHLRTGLDAQMAAFAGLVQLLIAKGVLDEQEYFATALKALEDEVHRYEARLSLNYGVNITLG